MFCIVLGASIAGAQSGEPDRAAEESERRAPPPQRRLLPSRLMARHVEKMVSQCVTLETELGAIEIAFMPEVAPEAVRNFLNLSATGAFDTTTFSRTVKGFVIQGGNLSDEREVGCGAGETNESHAAG